MGHTSWLMLRALAGEKIDWAAVHLFQADERVAIAGHPDRQLTHLHTAFLDHVATKPQLHAMPVESENLSRAAQEYAATLQSIAGVPPALDLVELELAFDGHTAALVDNDAALKITDRDVALTDYFHNRRRMTLTYPILNRARKILWVVTGDKKAALLQRLLDGDSSIPAGRVQAKQAVVIADQEAASRIEQPALSS